MNHPHLKKGLVFFAAFLLVMFGTGVSHVWAQEDSSSTDSSVTDTSNNSDSQDQTVDNSGDSTSSDANSDSNSDSNNSDASNSDSDTSGTDTQSDSSSSPLFNWWPFGNHSTSSDATTTQGWNFFGFHFGGNGSSTDASSSDATTTPSHPWWDLGGLFASSSTGDTGSTTPNFDFNDFLKNKLGFWKGNDASTTASTTDMATTTIPHHNLPTHQTKTGSAHQNNASGTITSISSNSFVVDEGSSHGQANSITVDVSSGVRVRATRAATATSFADLKVGMNVAVIGKAESDGNIEARIITILFRSPRR